MLPTLMGKQLLVLVRRLVHFLTTREGVLRSLCSVDVLASLHFLILQINGKARVVVEAFILGRAVPDDVRLVPWVYSLVHEADGCTR